MRKHSNSPSKSLPHRQSRKQNIKFPSTVEIMFESALKISVNLTTESSRASVIPCKHLRLQLQSYSRSIHRDSEIDKDLCTSEMRNIQKRQSLFNAEVIYKRN